jgi:protein O-mannosyl-transferase
LLFGLFHRMTGAVWKSAFVAAVFALHPLRVESVAYIAERKDVLSAFFWMLTLYLYVYYTEKPIIRRYLPVLLCFACGLMSKSFVVTLPIIMILLDYWPLGRFQPKKGRLILWQLREKASFFVLSAVFSIMTIYTQYKPYGTSVKQLQQYFPSFSSRIANALVSFVTYLEKTFWPYDLAAFYAFPDQPPVWQVLGVALVIIVISAVVIAAVKRLPYLLVGWLWYTITLIPVLGIIPIVNVSASLIADRYTYLPSIGIGIMLAWGVPFFIKSEDMRKKILFPAGIAILVILSVLTWRQCGYWKNSMELVNHTLQVTKDNYLAHMIRGKAYYVLGQYQRAIADCDEAIRLKPDFAAAYFSRGVAYDNLGQYQSAIADYSETIRLKPDYVPAYKNRGLDYGKYLGQYKNAIEDFNTIIKLQPNYARTYHNRGIAYLAQGNKELGCRDARKACYLGDCELFETAKRQGLCP